MLTAGPHRLGLDRRPLRRRGHRQHEDASAGRGRLPAASDTKIYTIGLDRPELQARHAQGARGRRARRVRAGDGQQDLAPLFDQLGQQISNEYLLQYKSLRRPGQARRRPGGRQRSRRPRPTGYRTPRCRRRPRPLRRTSRRSGTASWTRRSRWSCSPCSCAAVIAFLVIALLQPKRSGLPARMAEFVSIRGLQKDKGRGSRDGRGRAAEQNDVVDTVRGDARDRRDQDRAGDGSSPEPSPRPC